MAIESNQALFRLATSDGVLVSTQEERCRESSFSAASPLGADVRFCSMSLTEDGASPMAKPMSESVMPLARKSDIRDAHVTMGSSLRHPVMDMQRHAVTEFRQNISMGKYIYPVRFKFLGERVQHWREKREKTLGELAKEAGVPYSSLAEIESTRVTRPRTSKHTPALARALRVNAYYLATDEGDPEDLSTPVPEPQAWPIALVDQERFLALDETERELAELQFLRTIEKIEANRPKRHKGRKAS